MALTSKNTFNIDPLNGKNYHTWKFRIGTLLAEQGVEGMIETEFISSNYTDGKKREEAKRKDSKCKSIIVQCVDDNRIELIRGRETAYSMWRALAEMFERKGLPGQLYLKRQLMSLKLREHEDLDEFLTKFDDILCQLRATGADIKEEDTVCHLLMSLPKSFEMVVAVLENVSTKDLNLDVVKSRLRSEVEKRKLTRGTSSEEYSKSAAFISNKPGVCYGCGEQGHYKRDCRRLRDDRKRQGCNGERSEINKGQYGNNQLRVRRSGDGQGITRRFNNNVDRTWNRQSEHKQHWGQRKEQLKGGNCAEKCEPSGTRNDKSICFMSDCGPEVQDVQRDEITFFLDSGCTDHLVNRKEYFSNLMTLKKPIKIAIAKSDSYIQAIGIGNIKVLSYVNGEAIDCTVKNVFYVPSLRKNLLSVKRLEMSNIKVVFEKGQVRLFNGCDLIGIGNRNNLYEITFEILNNDCLNVETEDDNVRLWHRRYGHVCYPSLEKLIKNDMVDGLNNLKMNKIQFCESCVYGKMNRLKFGQRNRGKRLLEIVCSDICGPINPISYDGCKYFITFIDDYSSFVCVYLAKNKSDLFSCFKEYVQMAQSRLGQKILTIRCDNAKEYSSHEFRDYCSENGIIIDYTVTYTPQQNGKAERFNRSLVDMARTMMEESNTPKELWNEAIRTAAYLLNRSPSATLDDVTPAELWYNRKPNVKNLRVFGSTAYAHVPKELRGKLDSKAEKCIVVGYSYTGYRLWNVEKKKLIIARDVVFNEKSFYYRKEQVNVQGRDEDTMDESEKEEAMTETEINSEDHADEAVETGSEESYNKDMDGMHKRTRKLPSKYDDFEMYMAFDAVAFVEQCPASVEELHGRHDEHLWKEAMERELDSINKNRTWESIKVEDSAEVLDTKWVYSFKPHEKEERNKYKARLVVRGFAQEKTFNYDEIYSPVAKMATIRTLLAIGNKYNYYFVQLDVTTAFLNSKVNETIYIYPPKGVKCKKGYLLKLNKSLYGLKQASRCWNDDINNYLIQLDFKRSSNDFCLYSKECEKGVIYLLLYVDDIILAGPNCKLIELCKVQLMKRYNIKDKGKLKYFLGLEIEYNRDNGILKIGQERYTLNILRRFNFENAKACATPIDPKLKLKLHDSNNNDMINKPVKELIGCLMYLMLGTRPDISYAINYLSRYQDKSHYEVWNYLKRILRYLRGTSNLRLMYVRSETKSTLISYVDSDWGGDIYDRKSVTGYLIKVFDNTVAWVTRKQKCVALSTTEAELVALCNAVQDSIWFRKLLMDMNIVVKHVIIHEDNQGCISLLKSPENNHRVKHIDLKYNYIVDEMKKGSIIVQYINTENQQADILTKGLPNNQFHKLRNELGLVNANN